MFGIGLPELILILAIALIVVGPEKLPELAKSIAKGMLELKKAASSLKDSLQEEEDVRPWEKNVQLPPPQPPESNEQEQPPATTSESAEVNATPPKDHYGQQDKEANQSSGQ